MKENRLEAITKLLKKHPLHQKFIGKVLNELAEENIRTSIKQAFLGCHESELLELADFANGFIDIPPVIESRIVTPEPIPVPVVAPVIAATPMEVSHAPEQGKQAIPAKSNEGKSQGIGKSNSKAKSK